MVRQTARVMFFEILGGTLFLAVVAASILAWRLSQGPLELTVFKDDVEAALAQARGGRDVELERLLLVWSPERRRMDVTAQGVTFFAGNGAKAGTANHLDIELDASALLLGQVDVLGIDIVGGNLEVRQIDEANWLVAGEPLPEIPAGTVPETPAEWLNLINRFVTAGLKSGQSLTSEMTLHTIRIDELSVDVILASGETIAKFQNARGEIQRLERDLTMVLTADGISTGLPETVGLNFNSENDFANALGNITVTGWSLQDVGERFGAAEGQVSGLDAVLEFGFAASSEAGVTQLDARANALDGSLSLGETNLSVVQIDATALYDVATDRLDLNLITLDTSRMVGPVEISLADAMFGDGDRDITLFAPTLSVDLRPTFERRWQVSDLNLDVSIAEDFASADLSAALFRVRGAQFRVSGDWQRHLDPGEGELPMFLNIAAEMTGASGKRTVLDFWPVRLGDGARRFVENNITDATLTGATARLTLTPQSMSAGHLKDEDLEVGFSVRDSTVQFLHDVAPVEQAAGTGRLTGNSFSIDIARGAWSEWTLDTGRVEIPQLNPRGGNIIINGTGTGPINDAVGAVFRSRLDLENRTGFNPDRLSGVGSMDFTITRPALSKVPIDQTTFAVTGNVRGGGLTDVAAGMSLTDSTARVDVTNERVTISGFGALGPATVNFEWRDGLNDGDAPSSLKARSVVSPDILNRFGLLGRPYISGEVPVEVDAQLNGNALASSRFELDLTGARLDFAEFGWLKPPGDPASATIEYSDTVYGRSASASVDSETAKLEGSAAFSDDGRLISADVDRVYLASRADLAGRVQRGEDGAVFLSLTGAYLDVSNALPDVSAIGSGASSSLPVTVDAEVNRLQLSDDFVLEGARLAAISTSEGLQTFSVGGELPDGGAVDLDYQRASEGIAKLHIDAANAGGLVKTFLGTDVLIGGRLSLDGTLRSADAESDFNIMIEDSRLRDSPFLTQILSLASLRGLADTLGGEGVLFTRIDLPLRSRGGRIAVDGGRASGPALGLTVNGWLD
ncbi:MAG: DUF3971 domain-containing protein, partial [Pseudomonadota bacterium]